VLLAVGERGWKIGWVGGGQVTWGWGLGAGGQRWRSESGWEG
jgi:hypothetical protein